MEIRYYLRVFQRGWWLILTSILFAVSMSLAYSYYVVTPVYESVARFIVFPNLENLEGRDAVTSLATLDKRSIISTYAEVLNSSQIINSTIEALGENPENYSAYQMSVTVLPDANIIRFSVQGPNPGVTESLANSIGQYAIGYIRNLYTSYNIDFLDKAIVTEEPIKPVPLQNAMLALLAGVVVGLSLSILREQLSNTLEEVSRKRSIDSESKAYTRTYFERTVRREIANQPGGVFTMGIIHLAGIQDIYDTLPQAYLTRILQDVTRSFRYQLRGNDVIGRWSELQFVVLLLSTDGASAIKRMDKICEGLSKPISLDTSGQFDVLLDPRIGLANYQGGESFISLAERAEQALEMSRQSENRINLKVLPFT